MKSLKRWFQETIGILTRTRSLHLKAVSTRVSRIGRPATQQGLSYVTTIKRGSTLIMNYNKAYPNPHNVASNSLPLKS
ncbi:hypothetical protein SESBI_30586 [Sesbania bispinosa]|nr:hypothetical protein SESBI_30586 [Sesbania bispinosa]